MPVYLDYCASAPIAPEVLDVLIETSKNVYGNAGSRTHAWGRRANQVVEDARTAVAEISGAQPADVYFTSGATEANNIVLLGLARLARPSDGHIISTAIEHKSVLEPLEYLRAGGFEVDLVAPEMSGAVNAREILRLVRPDTLLVSVMHANNETGTIQPVQEIGHALRQTTTLFHVDAAQTFGKLVPELVALECDYLTASAHKLRGPQGVGALIAKRRRPHRAPYLTPIMFGGGQERGIRPGTLPVPLIAAFGKASRVAATDSAVALEYSARIRESILRQLSPVRFNINGTADSVPYCLNISFPGVNAEALMIAVGEVIGVSNGSACTSYSYEHSHVLSQMGLQPERIEESIRLSWGTGCAIPDLSPLVSFVKDTQEARTKKSQCSSGPS